MPPLEPMLAKSVPDIPVADGMTYEPKWDGFRCIIFRDGEVLTQTPYPQRRARLEQHLAKAHPPVHLTPTTTDTTTARQWFEVFEGAGLDGLVAKPADLPYEPGKRLMYKIKHARTADVVVAGFRYHKSGPIVGSLLLGLYDDDGRLHHVGVSASFPMERRAQLLEEIAPLRMGTVAGHPWAEWGGLIADMAPGSTRMPGGVSRWTGKKDLSWEPLRPERGIEGGYDAMEGDRFRHTAQFRRWRPDRTPESCTYDQLDRPVRFNVDEVLAG